MERATSIGGNQNTIKKVWRFNNPTEVPEGWQGARKIPNTAGTTSGARIPGSRERGGGGLRCVAVIVWSRTWGGG